MWSNSHGQNQRDAQMQYSGTWARPVCKIKIFRKICLEESFVEEFKVSKEEAIMWLSPFENSIMFYNEMSKHWIMIWKPVTWKLCHCKFLDLNQMFQLFLWQLSAPSPYLQKHKPILKLQHLSQHAQKAYVDDITKQGWEARQCSSTLWPKPWDTKHTIKEHREKMIGTAQTKSIIHIIYMSKTSMSRS